MRKFGKNVIYLIYLVIATFSKTAIAQPDYEIAVRNTLNRLPQNELIVQFKRCKGKETEYCGIVRSVLIKKMFEGNIDEYEKWRKRK